MAEGAGGRAPGGPLPGLARGDRVLLLVPLYAALCKSVAGPPAAALWQGAEADLLAELPAGGEGLAACVSEPPPSGVESAACLVALPANAAAAWAERLAAQGVRLEGWAARGPSLAAPAAAAGRLSGTGVEIWAFLDEQGGEFVLTRRGMALFAKGCTWPAGAVEEARRQIAALAAYTPRLVGEALLTRRTVIGLDPAGERMAGELAPELDGGALDVAGAVSVEKPASAAMIEELMTAWNAPRCRLLGYRPPETSPNWRLPA